MIKFTTKELNALVEEKTACVVLKTLKQILSLHASCLGNVKKSVQDSLSSAVGKFDKRLDGVMLGYANTKICSVGMIRNDSPDVYYEVEANFYVFRPYFGAVLRGVVNRNCNTHLSVLVHKVFNVVIPRPVNRVTFSWTEDYWIGTRFKIGQETLFKIDYLDIHCPLPYIRGTIEKSNLDETDFNIEEEANTKTHHKSKRHKNKELQNHTVEDASTSKSTSERKAEKRKMNLSRNDTDSKGHKIEDVEEDASASNRRVKKRKINDIDNTDSVHSSSDTDNTAERKAKKRRMNSVDDTNSKRHKIREVQEDAYTSDSKVKMKKINSIDNTDLVHSSSDSEVQRKKKKKKKDKK